MHAFSIKSTSLGRFSENCVKSTKSVFSEIYAWLLIDKGGSGAKKMFNLYIFNLYTLFLKLKIPVILSFFLQLNSICSNINL